MKSYCIKSNNDKIIEYLLDWIENINFENIYYCSKNFEIYKNGSVINPEKYFDKSIKDLESN